MKFLRFFIISVLVLFAITTFLFSLFPSRISISRIIEISATREKLSTVINNLKTWPYWNKWVSDSTLTNRSITAVAGAVGSHIDCDQFNINILQASMDSLSLVWYKKGGRPFTGKFILIDSPPGQVDLQWMLEFHFRWYPWEKLAAMFYDRQLGPEMETILAALKSYVEKNT